MGWRGLMLVSLVFSVAAAVAAVMGSWLTQVAFTAIWLATLCTASICRAIEGVVGRGAAEDR
ncbi:hypothetical protein [Microbacterium paludicola]|uniref:hypothetical protein n=1 Tax=Microbacterium paludicola TaxID=300019 RepID=UPI0031D5362B